MFAWALIVTLLVATTAALDVSTTHSLLGKRALLLSAALPFEHESTLPCGHVLSRELRSRFLFESASGRRRCG